MITIPITKKQLGFILLVSFACFSTLVILDHDIYPMGLVIFCAIYLTILGIIFGMLGMILLGIYVREHLVDNKIGFKK